MKCKFCDKEAGGTKRFPSIVCKDHFSTICPLCGNMAFWLETKNHPMGRYVYFRVSPYCDWVSETLDHEQQTLPNL